MVDWLYTHVEGFKDRREARKYASSMLKHGYLRHTVNKITFSEQCYYVFGDLCGSKFPSREGQGRPCAVSSVPAGGTEQSPVGQGGVPEQIVILRLRGERLAGPVTPAITPLGREGWTPQAGPALGLGEAGLISGGAADFLLVSHAPFANCEMGMIPPQVMEVLPRYLGAQW